jgi:hypothetical protein
MTWVEEILNALTELGGVASYSEIYEYLENTTTRNLSSNWQAVVRGVIEDHSSDAQFRSGKDLFYSAKGIGYGVWGVRKLLGESIVANDFDDSIEFPEREEVRTTRIIRDTKKVKSLKLLYKNKCQICSKTMIIPSSFYSEGHHIKPLGNKHGGPDIESNILILCPNHHAEFDYGAIAVDPTTLRIVHVNEADFFHGKRLFINSHHLINPEYLHYHYEKIFRKSYKDR